MLVNRNELFTLRLNRGWRFESSPIDFFHYLARNHATQFHEIENRVGYLSMGRSDGYFMLATEVLNCISVFQKNGVILHKLKKANYILQEFFSKWFQAF